MNKLGKEIDAGTVRMERLLPGPIERVWEYLTDSEKRGKWLASGTMEMHVGGKVELNFKHSELSAEGTPEEFKKYEGCHPIPGVVTRIDAPRLLSYTWPGAPEEDSEVTFELTAQGSDVLLVVTHRRLPSRKEKISVASGWDTHVGILEDVLRGNEPRPFWTTHSRLEAEYDAAFER